MIIINIVAIAKTLDNSMPLGGISEEYFKTINQFTSSELKLLRFIDIYDNTFFNKKQLKQLNKEVQFLLNESNYWVQESNALKNCIEFILNSPNYDFLWLIGN